MNRALKRIIVLLVFISFCGLGYAYYKGIFTEQSLSPKDTVAFKLNDLKLEVKYNRPSKRDRDIFGGLVSFNKVWRTGANEATTFKTNSDLIILNDTLPKGKYTLWTIPNKNNWQIIFNKKQYKWGVDEQMQPARQKAYDALIATIPTHKINSVVEQFTIAFDNSTDKLYLTLAWDTTKIVVPLKQSEI